MTSEDTGTQAMRHEAGAVPKLLELKFPVWLCVLRESKTGAVLSGKLQGGARFIAVFTSRTVAEDYLARHGLLEQAEAVEFLDPCLFVELLEDVQKQGCSHVVVHDEQSDFHIGLAVPISTTIMTLKGAS